MTSLVACTEGAFARGVLPSEPSATLKVKGSKGSQAPVHPMTATQQVPGTDSAVTALLPLVNKRLILEDGTP